MERAIPTANGKLCMHCGPCEKFALLDVDPEKNPETLAESPSFSSMKTLRRPT